VPGSELRSFADLEREQLAALVPELLLCGHLIDRAGMPHAIAALGREGMTAAAIDEWMAASPVYTARMQRALGFEGGGVETIFKGMQIDIGAPPQFMDFRYRLDDRDTGEFRLDHCGALLDVEPMGEDYVVAMCHDIEDPTFDATAIATDPRAQVRPIHRPPREPSDRHPHCAWTVVIRPEHEPLPIPEPALRMGATRGATVELSPIDPTDDGRADYAGPLLDDLRFGDWSRSALVRIAEEVCLQGHLLALGFRWAIDARVASADDALAISRRQLAGIAGLAAERLDHLLHPAVRAGAARSASSAPGDPGAASASGGPAAASGNGEPGPASASGGPGAASASGDSAAAFGNEEPADPLTRVEAVLAVHPLLHPVAYTGVERPADDRVLIRLPRTSPAVADGGWLSLVDADHLDPLHALVRGVDPHLAVAVVDDRPDSLLLEVVVHDEPAPESGDVALTRFSGGASFAFADRGTPVAIGPPRG